MLDLDTLVKPCTKRGTRYRPELRSIGGKEQVPFLIDSSKDIHMYESEVIIKYLFKEYGPGEQLIPPLMLESTSPLSTFTSRIATSLRPFPHAGYYAFASRNPEKPLHLYGYEGCPHSRLVREALDSLELSYYVHNVAPGTLKHHEFAEITKGHCETPFLIDDNTSVRLFDANAIVEYLYYTYKL
jgi:glutathione S-transferase